MWADSPHCLRQLNSLAALPITTWHQRMGHVNWEAIKKVRVTNPPSTVFYWTKPNPRRRHVLAVLLGRPSTVCSKRPPLGTPKPTIWLNESIQILWDLWKCSQLAVPVTAVSSPMTRPPSYGSTSSSPRTKLLESVKSSRQWPRTYPEERSSSSIQIAVENSYLTNSRSIVQSTELFRKPRCHTHHNKTVLPSG